MKKRIAVIADVHGNLEALKVTLNDIKKREIDTIYCLGDIVGKGNHPRECIDLVFENCKIILKGNLEEHITKKNYSQDNKRDVFFAGQLDDEYIKKINGLPFCYEIYMSGSLIRFLHASPTSVYDKLPNSTLLEEKIKAFYPTSNTISDQMADIVIYADNHVQSLDRLYNRTLINVGSVGNSTNIIRDETLDANVMETTQSFYLILTGDFDSKEYNSSLSYEFIRLPYDIDKELVGSDNLVDRKLYLDELKKGKYKINPRRMPEK
jgi:Predicted phosphoesterase